MQRLATKEANASNEVPYNILIVLPVAISKSHKNVFWLYWHKHILAKSGHSITFITPYPPYGIEEGIHENTLLDRIMSDLDGTSDGFWEKDLFIHWKT
jgi:hypothetical protein